MKAPSGPDKMAVPTGPTGILHSSSGRGAQKVGGKKPAAKPKGLSCSPGMSNGAMKGRR